MMNEFKVGLLALLTIAAITFMSVKITSNQSGFGDYITYRTIVSDASGIFPKTPIRVAGISAGRIKQIELQGNNALITFEVLKRVKITKGSRLRVKTVGFLGDKYLEIIVAKGDTRLEEMELVISETGAGLEAIAREATEVLQEIKEVVRGVKQYVASDTGVAPMTQIVEDMKVVAANTKDITKSLKKIITGNEERLDQIVKNMDGFTSQLQYQLNTAKNDSAINDVKRILANMDKMTSDLKLLVADVKSGKGTLGKILVEDEIADEVKETLAGVKKIVSKVDSIRTELSLFSGVNNEYGGVTSAGLKIFPSPERFYLLGITTTDVGVEKEKKTTTIINGVETEKTEKTVEQNSYVFDVQIGRIIHSWTFRGGLIESSGGVGIDYYSEVLSTTFSVEAFDYRKNIGPNLRLSTQIHLWNVLYGKLQYDDALTKYKNYTISAGLRFTDEDMKSLIGFFL